MAKKSVSVFWFRRDLRLIDNHGLFKALNSGWPVLPLFIFDTEILDELEQDDARVSFIYEQLEKISRKLKKYGSSLFCEKGTPDEVWQHLLKIFDIKAVFTNEDYEPYAIQRDDRIEKLLAKYNIPFQRFKDQVIFAKSEILKKDQTPYTVFTPYKNKWMEHFNPEEIKNYEPNNHTSFLQFQHKLPKIEDLGFLRSNIKVKEINLEILPAYEEYRNFPGLDRTSYLSPHLRFGTVSIRRIVKQVYHYQAFLSELIWREFFMQILYHFPRVVDHNFKAKYNGIQWRNDPLEFERWKKGMTGYPMVDAGMRELTSTGYMHNRVRMVVAGFLCKHLLIDWRWGETWFAKKLLDFELSSNNGNWQWAAGTGCDAAPYFRVFNPGEQLRKFDPDGTYVNQWIPELNILDYPAPMIEHKMARERAIESYKKGLMPD